MTQSCRPSGAHNISNAWPLHKLYIASLAWQRKCEAVCWTHRNLMLGMAAHSDGSVPVSCPFCLLSKNLRP